MTEKGDEKWHESRACLYETGAVGKDKVVRIDGDLLEKERKGFQSDPDRKIRASNQAFHGFRNYRDKGIRVGNPAEVLPFSPIEKREKAPSDQGI